MKQNNAQRVIENYMYNRTYFKVGDPLFVDTAGEITCNNTPIGYFTSGYSNITDEYLDFLVLTLQTYKCDRYWERAKKALIKAANEHDIIVVFKNEIDIGFGKKWIVLDDIPMADAMIRAAKLSNATPKLSAFGKDIDWDLSKGKQEPDDIYSCCQWHNNYVIPAEIAVLLYATRDKPIDEEQRYAIFVMEQCGYDALSTLAEHYVPYIGYYVPYQKPISDVHWELLDAIQRHDVRHFGYPVKMNLLHDKKIEKYCLKQLEGENKC